MKKLLLTIIFMFVLIFVLSTFLVYHAARAASTVYYSSKWVRGTCDHIGLARKD